MSAPSQHQHEPTAEGEQMLVPGVTPTTPRHGLRPRADAPLVLRRAQEPCDVGLFDEDARNQLSPL